MDNGVTLHGVGIIHFQPHVFGLCLDNHRIDELVSVLSCCSQTLLGHSTFVRFSVQLMNSLFILYLERRQNCTHNYNVFVSLQQTVFKLLNQTCRCALSPTLSLGEHNDELMSPFL